jgi:ribosomal protein S18 acetylase RimI-like enzyme
MMDFAVSELMRMGCKEVFLWTLEKNIRAKLFYEKYGFVFDGSKKEIQIGKPLPVIRYVFKNILYAS